METTAATTNGIPPPHPSSPSFKSSPSPAQHPSPQLDLYTIPTHSCWFSWDSIHDTERIELPDFFNNSSFTRTVKIYKEYRDFIISKYREDPLNRLTFTQVRKSLVGDVSALRKVFNFLDKWGLINFSAPPPDVIEDVNSVRVTVEEGTPVGVRVLVAPGSLKQLVPPPSGAATAGPTDGGGNLRAVSQLASYSDVFGEVRCGSCMAKCVSNYYECTKEKYKICSKCFEKGYFEENNSKDEFKMNGSAETSRDQGAVWSDAETLLLLESILKHGDNWELVAQNVGTKTKHECVSQLIELPFGELMLGSRENFSSRTISGNNPSASTGAGQNQNSSVTSMQQWKAIVDANKEQKRSSDDAVQDKINISESSPEKIASSNLTRVHKALNDSQESTEIEDNHLQQSLENHHLSITERENGCAFDILEPPSKKSRIDASDPSRSLMEQVALISTMVGSRITAAAARAAVSVLSDGNPLVRDIFYIEDQALTAEQRTNNLDIELERALDFEDSEIKDASQSSEVDKIISVRESIPLALRTRAAVGTALGAAAAHAKLLADQEEREMAHLVAFITETQMKKLECKVKLFEDLEQLMEKVHSVLDESKDSIIAQRIGVLQRISGADISRTRNCNSLRVMSGSD